MAITEQQPVNTATTALARTDAEGTNRAQGRSDRASDHTRLQGRGWAQLLAIVVACLAAIAAVALLVVVVTTDEPARTPLGTSPFHVPSGSAFDTPVDVPPLLGAWPFQVPSGSAFDAPAYVAASSRPAADSTPGQPQLISRGVDYGAEPMPDTPADAALDVWAIEGLQNAPVIVVLHGLPGARSDMTDLSVELAERGYLVLNTGYRVNSASAGLTSEGAMLYDAACAVKWARANATRFGGNPENVTVVGQSWGGLLGSILSLNGDAVVGPCANDAALSAEPNGLVALAAPVDALELTTPEARANFEATPELWAAFNPYEQLAAEASEVSALVIHGGADEIILLATSERFVAELAANGGDVEFVVLPGVGHDVAGSAATVSDLVDGWMAER